jgi:transposase
MRTPPPITSPYAPDLGEVRAWLEKTIAALRFVELVTAIVALIARLCSVNTELTKQLAGLRRKRPRSERLEWLRRQLMLPLVAGIVQPPPPASSGNKPKGSRRGRHPGRARPPENLARVEVPNPVPSEMRRCPKCGAEMTTVAHTVGCETINVIPAKVIVEVRIDETVACPNDDTIVSAPTPNRIVEGGKLGDGLIVEATADKYLEHMPVERQCARFARRGVHIAPQTLGRSVSAHIDLLQPLAALIAEQTRAPGLLGTDATGIPVLDPGAREGIRSGTIWCWTNARWVTFFYSPSGDSDSVKRFLGEDNLARTVQCDGTSVTTFLERCGGKRPGCWSHARRGFVEAARTGDKIALEALGKIAPIFAIERASALAGETAEQRKDRRAAETAARLAELRSWLDAQRQVVPPKTPLGRALGYLQRQWKRLVLFLEDGNIEATNNRRERELRRLPLGRKNWLFTWLDIGGDRTAAILTIVATCVAHDVNPRAYLHLVTRLIVNRWPRSRLRDLLPDRILASHPELFVGQRDELPTARGAPPSAVLPCH